MSFAGPVVAELWRGDVLEGVHCGAWVETDTRGRVLGCAGDAGLVTTLRSAQKPLQAAALLATPGSSRLGLTDEQLAVCCASHSGTPRHVALVAGILERIGCDPDSLVCGAAGDPPSPLKHGCSGNHATMLAMAWLLDAPLRGYQDAGHPAQKQIRDVLAHLCDLTDVPSVTDACGVPTYVLRLGDMARLFAWLAEDEAPAACVADAMATHADLIGSADWVDVRLMQLARGRIVAKTGAEGLLLLGLRQRGGSPARGMAVKILDGNPRALGPAVVGLLIRQGWLTEAEANDPGVADLRRPCYRTSTGEDAAFLRGAV